MAATTVSCGSESRSLFPPPRDRPRPDASKELTIRRPEVSPSSRVFPHNHGSGPLLQEGKYPRCAHRQILGRSVPEAYKVAVRTVMGFPTIQPGPSAVVGPCPLSSGSDSQGMLLLPQPRLLSLEGGSHLKESKGGPTLKSRHDLPL